MLHWSLGRLCHPREQEGSERSCLEVCAFQCNEIGVNLGDWWVWERCKEGFEGCEIRRLEGRVGYTSRELFEVVK